ncbi:MAG TPA: SPOR domain-containing protein [Ignavibacteriales bacterium]|nr:SPOR domain-containing protein [Ignavibacteriales bacterium]
MRIILKTVLFLFLLCLIPAYAQEEVNITPYLRQIESGQLEAARQGCENLKKTNPKVPSVMFLDAMLTQDGKEALAKYSEIYQKYPKSRYADASLYWVYSYHYALGNYTRAASYMDELKKNYPKSSFLTSGKENSSSRSDSKNMMPAEEKSFSRQPQKAAVPQSKKNLPFTIQAGAFLSEENALKLMDSFRSAGYFTELKKKDVAGSTLNIVNVGKFENGTEAHKTLDFINMRYKLSGRVVRTGGK